MKNFFNKKVVLILSVVVVLLILGYLTNKFFPFFDAKLNIPKPGVESNRNINFEITSEGENKGIYNITGDVVSDLKLIKKGRVTLEVEKGKFYETLNKLNHLINQFNGNIIGSQIYREDNKSSGNITIMIPSEDFDIFISKLNDLGKIKNVSTSAKDVTGEYYDLNGRFKILESQKELLLSWLKDAKDIKDMLSIRSELERIETEIESIKGRINYIDYHTKYSELSIYLSEESVEVPWWKKSEFLKRVINRLLYALNGIVTSILALIIIIAYIIPWVLVGYLIYLLVLRFLKKKEAKG
ncbi:MAG: DUF4349 domain-containing protein [Caldisericia bacterium]